jgi:hypothetical protein
MNTLVGMDPGVILPHGPSKLLVDEYLWHSPNVGIVAAYTPNEWDVMDHFGVFRAVDQVESFGQAVVVSCSAFLDTAKMGLTYKEYYQLRNFVFVGIKSVHCHDVIRYNEQYVCLGVINFYKFRQMTASGRIYKVPAGLDTKAYFKDFTEERLRNYDLDKEFVLATELHDILGKGIKNELLAAPRHSSSEKEMLPGIH